MEQSPLPTIAKEAPHSSHISLSHKSRKILRDLETFISKTQSEDGGFSSSSFISAEPAFQGTLTTFYTSLILSAISRTENSICKNIVLKGVSFLRKHQRNDGAFNYLATLSSPYPHDLDDTVCAWRAIAKHGADGIPESSFASIIALLIANESSEGGPYFTWLVPAHIREQWDDIDPVVNANILSFLSLFDIELPGTKHYIESILTSPFSSKYYVSELSLWYAMPSTGASAKIRLRIKTLLKREKDPLFMAQGCIAYCKMGGAMKDIAHELGLLNALYEEGSWKYTPSPFFIEEIKEGAIIYSGCVAYTAALFHEAFSWVYASQVEETPSSVSEEKADAIYTSCTNSFKDTSPLMQNLFQKTLLSIRQTDTMHEIALTPAVFEGRHTTLSRTLGMANVFGWIGYTVCDDILDGEKKERFLPVATKCLREMYACFSSVVPRKHMRVVTKILDGIEQANVWEHAHAKLVRKGGLYILPDVLPSYGSYAMLAEKSLGHALGPMIISLKKQGAEHMKNTEAFFRHYIIARQLNDDAHDWRKDLENGFLNSVSVRIIADWRKDHTDSSITAKTLEGMEEMYWSHTIKLVCRRILKECAIAESVLQSIMYDKGSKAFFMERISLLRLSAERALSERKSSLNFIKAYRAIATQ